jgi:hypothetical protein
LKDGPKSRVGRKRNYMCATGHDYKWLACGAIPKARVLKVMPYDGKQLYKKRTTKIVRSINSIDDWVFDWDKQKWILDPTMAATADMRAEELRKAQALERSLDGDDLEMSEDQPVKQLEMVELTIVKPYLHVAQTRKRTSDSDDLDMSKKQPAKRPKLIELTILKPYLHFVRPCQDDLSAR